MKSLFWKRMLLSMMLLAISPLAGCTLIGASASDSTRSPVMALTAPPPTPTLSSKNTPASQPVSGLVAADAGKSIHLEIGQTFTVTLEGNPSTGYSWDMSPVDKPILSEVGDPVSAPKSNLPGAPAMLTLTFRADANGAQQLMLIYHRPWEKDVPPVNSFDVNVIVGPAPQQTLPPTSTPDTRSTPTSVAYPAGGIKGWLTYTSTDYGFSFQYPPEWKIEPGSGTMTGHALLLKPDNLNAQFVVAFKHSDEDAQIGRTGVGNGELLPRGMVLLDGREINRTVLVFNSKDMTVLYSCTGCMVRGKVQFNFDLDYLGNWTDPTALTASVEAQADLIVASIRMK